LIEQIYTVEINLDSILRKRQFQTTSKSSLDRFFDKFQMSDTDIIGTLLNCWDFRKSDGWCIDTLSKTKKPYSYTNNKNN
jgi:hypothetical protein